MLSRFKYSLINSLILLHLFFAAPSVYARSSLSVAVDQETEINVEVVSPSRTVKGVNDRLLFIWQPHEGGLRPIDYELADKLAGMGIEVWLLDLIQAYFLSNTTGNMGKLNGDGFKALIDAGIKTGKTVVIGSSGRSAVPLLRGARDWQLANRDHSRFAGAISVSPKVYVKTPQPGEPAVLLPIVAATNLRYFILQPDKSPAFWQLNQTIPTLQQAGSEVYLQPLYGIRDRFYFRPDAYQLEHNAADQLAAKLFNAITLLSKNTTAYRKPHTTLAKTTETIAEKQERKLERHQGNPIPHALVLPDLNDKMIDLRSLKGKVVVINFWASWCPPCVHEMPSMESLYQQFKDKPFTILGVNMAESKAEVNSFLSKKVKVTFPIVMDYDGAALKTWRVYAFPTSYVVDKQGKIRYALFGSVLWDNPDIVSKIKMLINE